MMLVHMEFYLKGYFLMSISLQKYTVWKKRQGNSNLHGKNKESAYQVGFFDMGLQLRLGSGYEG